MSKLYSVLDYFRRSVIHWNLGLLLAVLAGLTMGDSSGSVLAARQFEAKVKRSDREQAGLVGPVRRIHISVRQLVESCGNRTEGDIFISHSLDFDASGRQIEQATYLGENIPDTKVTSKYDEKGNEVEHAFYVHDAITESWTATYDEKGRVIERVFLRSGAFRWTYSPNGRKGTCTRIRVEQFSAR